MTFKVKDGLRVGSTLVIDASGNILTKASNVTGTVLVANGGTGATTLTGIVKGNGTAAFSAATAGTDFVAPNTTTVGKLVTQAATTGGASLNIASGTAPTTPVAGDIWNESGVLKLYDGSTTKTIAFSSASIPSLLISDTAPKLEITQKNYQIGPGVFIDRTWKLEVISGSFAVKVDLTTDGTYETPTALFLNQTGLSASVWGNAIETRNNKGVADGYASLDSSGKLPSAQFPAITTSDVPEGSNLYFTDARAQAAFGTATSFQVGSTATNTGAVALEQGGLFNTGKLAFYYPNGTLAGTIGNASPAVDAQKILFQEANGSKFQFSSRPIFGTGLDAATPWDDKNLVNPLTVTAANAAYMPKAGYRVHSYIWDGQYVGSSTSSTTDYSAKTPWLYVNPGAIPSNALIVFHVNVYVGAETGTNTSGDAGMQVLTEVATTSGSGALYVGTSGVLLFASSLTSSTIVDRSTLFLHGVFGVNGYNYNGGLAVRLGWNAVYTGNSAALYSWYISGVVLVPA